MIAIPRPVTTLVDGGWATYVGEENAHLGTGQLIRDLRRSSFLWNGHVQWTGRPRASGDERMVFLEHELCPMVRG